MRGACSPMHLWRDLLFTLIESYLWCLRMNFFVRNHGTEAFTCTIRDVVIGDTLQIDDISKLKTGCAIRLKTTEKENCSEIR